MMSRLVAIGSGMFIVVSSACKSLPKSSPVAPASSPAARSPGELQTAAAIPPSPSFKKMPDLVTPSPEETMNRRSPSARCPTGSELEILEKNAASLGKETLDLVKEDLANIRLTSTRGDREGIASCCNQLEQLVQDTEIMNEEKEAASAALDRIRKMTSVLCPPH